MSDLPKSYMRIARKITGYWGTYLPSLRLQVGATGRRVDGVFVREGHLSGYPGYTAPAFGIDDQPPRDPTVVWTTRSVRMQVVNAEAKTPGDVATGGVRVNFGAANEAAIICNAPREQSFADLRTVKDLMWQLRQQGRWDDDLCVVTGLVSVDSAWICFSTASGQAAEIRATAPLSLPGDPTGALSALFGSAKLAVREDRKAKSGAGGPSKSKLAYQVRTYSQSRKQHSD
jgi:hypothetical protein